MSRRLFTVSLAILALLSFATIALAQGGRSGDRQLTSESRAAELEDEVNRASLEYEAARIAPASSVPGGAMTSAFAAASSLPTVGGAWSEVTNKPYDSDDPNYRDPVISNSGGGAGLVAGRMTALVVQANGTVWAGAADGGVWKSTNGGATWTATFDDMPSLSVGALAVDPANQSVWVGTGENNTAFENYRGAGVFRTTNGSTWALVGDAALDGTTIGKLAFDGNGNVFAATSRGLWKHSTRNLSAAWVKIFDAATFGYQAIPYGLSMTNDVVVRPGTNGQYIVANMSWRNGAAYDGFYVSTDGGATFARVKAGGAIVDNDIGSTSFAYSADGSALYAVVESPFQINHFTQSGGTTLQGVFVSPTGDASGPWNKIAEGRKLATSGSALYNYFRGYNPGVQAWYNRFIGVDPTDKQHVYLGLEEVFETTNGGSTWFAIGPYWNFGLPCSANGLDSCPKTTHPDQHAVAFGGGNVYVGNDGGVWRRAISDTGRVEGWSDLNSTLRTLQYYYAGAGNGPGGMGVWGGLQDNGGSLLLPGAPTMVSPFGGDGGDVIVDPADYNKSVQEYVYLDMFLTTNAGRSDGTTSAWREISPSCFAFTYTPSPCDPNPRFIAPFRVDVSDGAHWVAGGQYVWDNQGKGWDTTCGPSACDWKQVYNVGSGNTTTALAAKGSVIYAAWCGGPGACNPRSSAAAGSDSGFARGLATNYGGTWHAINATGLPNRYVYSLTVDPSNAATVYAVFGGFSRRWIAGGGVGHVFKSTDGGASWTDISGNLPDAPGDDLVLRGSTMYYASDVGVFSAAVGTTTWSQLGTGLPNASVNDLTFAPGGGALIAATHGRGIWKIVIP